MIRTRAKFLLYCIFNFILLNFTFAFQKIQDQITFDFNEIDSLKSFSDDPVVWISDADWGVIPVNEEIVKTIQIVNRGISDVILTKIEWSDKLHFTKVENLNFPISIRKGEVHEFYVYYSADIPGVVHKTTAYLQGNAVRNKLYSEWIGQGAIIETIDNYKYSNSILYPNPVVKYLNLTVENQVSLSVKIEIYDLKGIMMINSNYNSKENNNISIDCSKLIAGHYFLKMQFGSTIKYLKFLKE